MKVELSNSIVEIKDSLSWGDTQKIQATIIGGAKMSGTIDKAGEAGFDFDASTMLEAKYVALECAIVKIKEGDKESDFSREWMNNLSQKDGDKVFEAVDSLSKKE